MIGVCVIRLQVGQPMCRSETGNREETVNKTKCFKNPEKGILCSQNGGNTTPPRRAALFEQTAAASTRGSGSHFTLSFAPATGQRSPNNVERIWDNEQQQG
jgi:hypothetical protein